MMLPQQPHKLAAACTPHAGTLLPLDCRCLQPNHAVRREVVHWGAANTASFMAAAAGHPAMPDFAAQLQLEQLCKSVHGEQPQVSDQELTAQRLAQAAIEAATAAETADQLQKPQAHANDPASGVPLLAPAYQSVHATTSQLMVVAEQGPCSLADAAAVAATQLIAVAAQREGVIEAELQQVIALATSDATVAAALAQLESQLEAHQTSHQQEVEAHAAAAVAAAAVPP